jgi:hypothetical protein
VRSAKELERLVEWEQTRKRQCQRHLLSLVTKLQELKEEATATAAATEQDATATATTTSTATDLELELELESAAKEAGDVAVLATPTTPRSQVGTHVNERTNAYERTNARTNDKPTT